MVNEAEPPRRANFITVGDDIMPKQLSLSSALDQYPLDLVRLKIIKRT